MAEPPRLQKASKAQVALVLLSRPVYWPDMWRRAKLNIGQSLLPPPMGQGRDAATRWAASVAVSPEDALASLGLPPGEAFSLRHADILADAERIERASAETLGGGGGIDLIWRICEGLGVKSAIETGVAYGWSSMAILASVRSRGGRLVSVDFPRPLLKDKGLTGSVVPEAFRASWTLIREPDHTGLPKALAKAAPLDFAHYDSDKSYAGRAASYRRIWARLRKGGILMSDDIADNTAFRDFSAEVGLSPVVVHSPGSGQAGARHVGLLMKP